VCIPVIGRNQSQLFFFDTMVSDFGVTGKYRDTVSCDMVPLVVRVLTNKRVGNNIINWALVYEKVDFFSIYRKTSQVMKFKNMFRLLSGRMKWSKLVSYDENSVEKVGDDNYAREEK